jgi:NADPH-dependent 2,4-dienoyl-CoA reductase/sulfur reductase-like enzyme
MRILIIGGVAAGASAATKARRVNENAEIVIFEKGKHVSFANCGLPYYVGGDVPKLDDLLLVTPKLFKNRFNIDVRTEHEVLEIHPEHKSITVKHKDGVTNECYDKLILATGATPVLPPISGINLAGVHTVADIDDVEGIVSDLENGVEAAVVVGGGFIGIEIAEALLKRGIKTTLVEMLPQLLANYDPEFSKPVERHMKRMGLKLALKKALLQINGEDHVTSVQLSDNSEIPAQLVIMSTGMKPRLALAEQAGLQIGNAGGIVVDDHMMTSVPDIYAAGDITESRHFVTGEMLRNPLAGSANKQGRVAGANAAGGEMRYHGAQGTAIVRAGELTVARTGLNENEARERNLDFFVSYNPVRNHAVFYSNSEFMIFKLIVESKTGKILGAEAVGRQGTDKRIDVLATAIYAGLTVFDLENLDLAYAPPFSSARDPVLMAGMTAANVVRNETQLITAEEIKGLLKDENYVIVDTRRDDEFLCGSIRGAKNIPVDQMRQRYNEIDINKTVVLFCGEGYRAYVAGRILAQKGYKVVNLSGGYRTYTMDLR